MRIVHFLGMAHEPGLSIFYPAGEQPAVEDNRPRSIHCQQFGKKQNGAEKMGHNARKREAFPETNEPQDTPNIL
jgi:hypothetical protein